MIISNNLDAFSDDQSLYFDFLDEPRELSNYYRIHDKIHPNILSLSIPYNENYINTSGLVYIVDSTENIKTNKNPNIDNKLIRPTISYSDDSNSSPIILDKFNFKTNNKWKHGVSFSKNDAPNRLDATINNEETTVIIAGQDPLNLDKVEYSFDNNEFYTYESSLTTYINQVFYLKVFVDGGAGKWSDSVVASCPRLNIVGLDSYSISESNLVFNTNTNQWEITAVCEPGSVVSNNKIIYLTISDLYERLETSLTINIKQPLIATNISTVKAGRVGSEENWRIIFEVYGGTLSATNRPKVIIGGSSGFPGDTSIYYRFLNYTNEQFWVIIIEGLSPSVAGDLDISVEIEELVNPTERITTSGVLTILPEESEPEFKLDIRGFNNNIIIPNTDISNQFTDLHILVPVWSNFSETELNISFFNQDNVTIDNPFRSYMPEIKCYQYRANVRVDSGSEVTNPGFYSIGINAEVIRSGDLDAVTKTTGCDITVYDPISINLSEYNSVNPLVFYDNRAWSFNFYVDNGGVAHRSDVIPSVFIGNTPGIGTYNAELKPLEYAINKIYDEDSDRWLIYVTGLPDQFGNFVQSTGLYRLNIYAEDYTGFDYQSINLLINSSPEMFLEANNYSTTGLGFDFYVDVKNTGLTYDSLPLMDFPKDLRHPDIGNTKTYSKYDPNLNLWEFFYSGNPLVNKWDAELELSQNELKVKCKAINEDKIYVAGRVTTVESENEFTVFSPLTIVRLPTSIDITEGDPWELTFSTSGGLASPLYPPRIEMQGFPLGASCDGYDPTDEENQPPCFTSATWNEFNKEWDFEFNGNELCLKEVQFTIDIVATDTIDGTDYGTDTKQTTLEYTEGEDHPGPQIIGSFNLDLLPLCVSYSDSVTYGPQVRAFCPLPTGISGVTTSGSLPAGLSFGNSKFWFAPYNDTGSDSSGVLTINGFPTEFASGQSFEPFKITVTDARQKKVERELTFKDKSLPIGVSPIEFTIYFENDSYAYSPGTGTEPIQDNKPADILRPPPLDLSLECLSILPHNDCVYYNANYLIFNGNTKDIFITGIPISVNNIAKIYVKFDTEDQQLLDLSSKEYPNNDANIEAVFEYDNVLKIAFTGTHNIVVNETTLGNVEVLNTTNSRKENSNIKDTSFGGNPPAVPDPNTVTGIVGGGTYNIGQDGQQFLGLFRPAFKAETIPGVPFSGDSFLHDNLIVSPIDQGVSYNQPSIIKFDNNCYETGYIRVSGVILPKIELLMTDKQDISLNAQSIAVGVICRYFNENPAAQSSESNRRGLQSVTTDVSVAQDVPDDAIINITSGPSTISVTTVNPPTAFGFDTISNSGVILRSSVDYESDYEFPTYDRDAIPSLRDEHFTLHVARFDNNDPISQETYPPHVPINNKQFTFVSGTNIDESILIVGGHVKPEGIDDIYQPKISGFIQSQVPFDSITGIPSNDAQNNFFWYDLNIDITSLSYSFSAGNFVKITYIYTDLSDPIYWTGIIDDISSENIKITGFPYNSLSYGISTIDPLFQVSSNDPLFQVKIDCGSQNFYDTLDVNTSIDLVYVDNNQLSTQNYLTCGDYRLNVISGDNNQYWYAGIDALQFSGSINENSNIITVTTGPNPINILKPGYFLKIDDVGAPVQISSVGSNIITLTENYTDSSLQNQLIIHSGNSDINPPNDYYRALVNSPSDSGLCRIYKNYYNTNNGSDIFITNINNAANSNHRLTADINGLSNNFFGNYKYKVITCENTGIFNYYDPPDENLAVKTYGTQYDMIATIPLRPIEDVSHFQVPVDPSNNDNWDLTFHVTGGFIPKEDSGLIVELDNYIHIFNTEISYVSPSGARITITSNPLFNWSQYFASEDNNGTVTMKVFDSISSFNQNITQVSS